MPFEELNRSAVALLNFFLAKKDQPSHLINPDYLVISC
jgi:hypothetical protein